MFNMIFLLLHVCCSIYPANMFCIAMTIQNPNACLEDVNRVIKAFESSGALPISVLEYRCCIAVF